MGRKYVPTTLDDFLNENRQINLKRGYRGNPGINVNAKAPLRDRILTYVAENEGITSKELKKYIAGLNETSKKPLSAANMWLKRNDKFFEVNENDGTVRLSTVGKRLVNRLTLTENVNEGKKKDKKKKVEEEDHDFVDTKKGYARPGINDSTNENVNEEELKEKIRAMLSEDELPSIDENLSADLILEEDEEDELTFDDLDLDPDEEGEEGEEGEEDLEGEEGEEGEEELEGDEEKVELTEFIITVDNAQEAIEELKDLGVDAEIVDGEGGDEELDLEGGDLEGGDEEEFDLDGDLDLGDEGDLDLGDEGGEEGEELDLEEGHEGMVHEDDEELEDRLSALENKVKDLESGGGVGEDEEFDLEGGDLEAPDELDLGGEEDLEGGDELEGMEDLEGEEDEVDMGTEEIRVSAEDFPALKQWLEDKGVDVEDLLGGEVEMEEDGEEFEVGDAEDEDAEGEEEDADDADAEDADVEDEESEEDED